MTETRGTSPVEITGNYVLTPEQVTITARFQLQDPTALYNPRATFIIYEDGLYWCCGPDGNDTWNGVVRVIHDQYVGLSNPGDEETVAAVIPVDPSWDTTQLHFVAFLQDESTKEILQGKVLQPEVTSSAPVLGADLALRILGISPNPVGPETAIRFVLPRSQAAGPTRLDIVDASGRSLIRLMDGVLSPGDQVVRWDGSDARGSRLSNGLYFVRLSHGNNTRSAKVVLAE